MAEEMFLDAMERRSSQGLWLTAGSGDVAAELVADDRLDDGGEFTAGV